MSAVSAANAAPTAGATDPATGDPQNARPTAGLGTAAHITPTSHKERAEAKGRGTSFDEFGAHVDNFGSGFDEFASSKKGGNKSSDPSHAVMASADASEIENGSNKANSDTAGTKYSIGTNKYSIDSSKTG